MIPGITFTELIKNTYMKIKVKTNVGEYDIELNKVINIEYKDEELIIQFDYKTSIHLFGNEINVKILKVDENK